MHEIAAKSALARAQEFLLRAASPHADAWGVLQEVSKILEQLESHCVNRQIVSRLVDLLAHLQERPPALCDIRVAVDGTDVVIRIGCPPESSGTA